MIPKNAKNGVQPDIQVVQSERILGYNTVNGIFDKSKMVVDDSEYYNVTVNMVIKKGSVFSEPSVPPKPVQVEVTPKDATLIEEEPLVKPVAQKPTVSPDSNSNFLAAASLFGSEQQAELDAAEKYTSKIAKAEYKKIESREQKKQEENTPPSVINTQTEEEQLQEKEMENAIALAEKNQDSEDQLLLQTDDLNMRKRMEILHEEEFRHNQHKLFQRKLERR